MKICKDCGVKKLLSQFYKHPMMADGHLNSCKECRRAYEKIHRLKDPAVRENDRRRNRAPERRAHLRANAKRWRKKNDAGYRAHNAANNAIRDGRLERKWNCEKCGSPEHLHKHHRDYSRPLKVTWLCARCHARV